MMGSMMRRAMLGDGSTLNVDFTTGVLDSRLTFTRGSNATFINASGNVATASNNVARFDHDPTTGAPRGLLIEGTATNVALNSETFPTSGTGVWSYEDVTANATKITAPDGTANAIQFNETTANNVHRIGHSVSGSAGAVSVSVWVKVLQPGTPRRLFINANTFMNARGLFDIDPAVQTGASGTAVSVTGTAANKAGTWIKYPNDWYRCTLIGTYSTASTVYFQINRASSSTATDDIFAGSTTNGLAIWGAQVEAGSGASSYIPTGASTATRNADECSMTGTNFSSWYNQSEGTILCFHAGRTSGAAGRAVEINNNSSAERIVLSTDSTSATYLISDNGSVQVNQSRNAFDGSIAKRYAAAYSANNFAVSFNGAAALTDNSGTLPTVDRMWVGQTNTGLFLDSTISRIAYWPTRLPDATLQSLTT